MVFIYINNNNSHKINKVNTYIQQKKHVVLVGCQYSIMTKPEWFKIHKQYPELENNTDIVVVYRKVKDFIHWINKKKTRKPRHKMNKKTRKQ